MSGRRDEQWLADETSLVKAYPAAASKEEWKETEIQSFSSLSRYVQTKVQGARAEEPMQRSPGADDNGVE